jgi:hypothetical protein
MKAKLFRLAGICALMVYPHAANASSLLTYVGNNFNTFSGDYACPSQCSLNLSLTVPEPLTNYLAGSGFLPNTIIIQNPVFTSTDGLYTVTDQTISQAIASGLGNGIGATFEFVINATGQIDFSKGWIVSIRFNPLDLPGFGTGPQSYFSSASQGSGGLGTLGTVDQTYHFLPVTVQDSRVWTHNLIQ